eukprot:TRINITY_DN5977_c0_g1_i3.p1 TRINITY_DN5977_c0_g1~~TRINITY_DN5977_c0_g1_i3.p1  ORF type:complete len:284 (+),score=53.98 TRINITY_DN5977_c0_g1_i3:124-975(+)
MADVEVMEKMEQGEKLTKFEQFLKDRVFKKGSPVSRERRPSLGSNFTRLASKTTNGMFGLRTKDAEEIKPEVSKTQVKWRVNTIQKPSTPQNNFMMLQPQAMSTLPSSPLYFVQTKTSFHTNSRKGDEVDSGSLSQAQVKKIVRKYVDLGEIPEVDYNFLEKKQIKKQESPHVSPNNTILLDPNQRRHIQRIKESRSRKTSYNVIKYEPSVTSPLRGASANHSQHSVNLKELASKFRKKSQDLSLIHISEPTRLLSISYAVFCLKKKNRTNKNTLITLYINQI